MNKANAEKLATALVATIRIPDIRAKLAAAGAEVMTSTPKETSEFLDREVKRWSALIAKAGNQLEGNA
jgi:tripartite-type tricarboxylate transporter receptor subunit TctC